MIKIDEIQRVVKNSKNFPEERRPSIEYNGELPDEEGITPDSFYGVKAKFNKDVAENHCVLIYKF